jgi:aspartate aminotransferase
MGRRAADGRIMETDQDFAAYLLEGEQVAVVPGAAFGLSPHFRVSFAASMELLEQACLRIERACAALR